MERGRERLGRRATRTRKGEPRIGNGVEVVRRRDDGAEEDEHEQARQPHAGDEDDTCRAGVVDEQAGWVCCLERTRSRMSVRVVVMCRPRNGAPGVVRVRVGLLRFDGSAAPLSKARGFADVGAAFGVGGGGGDAGGLERGRGEGSCADGARSLVGGLLVLANRRRGRCARLRAFDRMRWRGESGERRK